MRNHVNAIAGAALVGLPDLKQPDVDELLQVLRDELAAITEALAAPPLPTDKDPNENRAAFEKEIGRENRRFGCRRECWLRAADGSRTRNN